MTESCVSFSILTDKYGELKITLDSAEKNFSSDIDTFSQGLSPSPSIKSLNCTNNSEDLCAGKRRRIVSSSTESLLTTDSFFDKEEVVLRSSTPVSETSDETESLSDVSFTSCVSRVSELSITTSSSQETVTSKNISLKAKNVNYFSEIHYGHRRKSITYEEKNKERYGGWAEGDWRSAMKPKETKSDRANYKSRIPALADRPSYHSSSSGRVYPANPVTYPTKSYVSAVPLSVSNYKVIFSFRQVSNQSASRNVPLNNVQQPIKLIIATNSNGNMKLVLKYVCYGRAHFQNSFLKSKDRRVVVYFWRIGAFGKN
ncbi:Protein CBR-HPO-32 [Caenorhabditis briggsae]|uniref:Protein CBR-HPO-32 n=1 Tax=Caenorhabditis briggsae TaxID=6238 RepID=A8XFL3_CAEBR|nr:Protein CBR-HPO-32 [Caenorhabditis briggsae]CAP31330.2 Protein CBR-HPO-32 [Caenorhabditis briggsae]